jgi:hypothetical protein
MVRSLGLFLFAVFICVQSSRNALAVEVLNGPAGSLDVWGRTQLLGVGEWVPTDTVRRHDRVYLYLEQARLGFDGKIGDYNYYTELSLGGEDVTTTSDIALTLLEFRFDVPAFDGGFIRLGQYKVPYGREFLCDDGRIQFTHRSIGTLGFYLGRDVGVALATTRNGPFSAVAGVFTGGSKDIPQRYLPEDLGIPLLSFRVGFDTTSESALANNQSGIFKLDKPEAAAYLSAAYMEDTIIGHSTVLNLRPTDINLLIDPNWNPYLAQKPFTKTQLLEGALDGVIRKPVGDTIWAAEGEINAGLAANDYGVVRMYGARLQGSATHKPWEYAVRYAVLLPDKQFAAGGQDTFAAGNAPVPITPSGSPIHEATASLTYYFKEWSRLVMEASVLVNVPVIHEAGIGSYVATEQPDQTTETIVTGTNGTSTVAGSIDREIVPEGQVMWQISF